MRPTRDIAGVLLIGLVLSACGARVDGNVRQQAADALLSGTGTGATGTTTGGSGNTATGPGGTVVPGAGGGGSTTTGGGGSGSTTGAGNGSGTGASGGGASGGGPTSGGGSSGGGGATTAGGSCPTGGTDVGLTASAVTLGTIASRTGPVSGLFEGAIQGAEAFRAFANSQGGICGRSVNISPADDGTSCDGNKNATEELASKVFAFVGSFSLYDGCGAPYLAQHTTIPDLHVQLSPDAGKPSSHFDMEPGPLGYATGMFAYYRNKYGNKVQAVGTIYPNIPSAAQKQQAFVNSAQSEGWKFVYSRAADAQENDWTSDFVKMCHPSNGNPAIQIFFTSAENAQNAAKMVQNEQQAGCPSDLINIIPIAYDQAFPQDVGNNQLIEGMQGWNEYSLFFNQDEAQRIPELQLLQGWFARTYPGKPLNLYALFAWAEGRLFQTAFEHAGKTINRNALLAALHKIHTFDANGIMAPVDPGSKTTGVKCYILWQYHAGKYERIDDPATGYRCDGRFLPLNG